VGRLLQSDLGKTQDLEVRLEVSLSELVQCHQVGAALLLIMGGKALDLLHVALPGWLLDGLDALVAALLVSGVWWSHHWHHL
jgi:hypothetical protein